MKNKETIEFKTEVNQLLDLMIHSLYSEKEIFLRELISNASDAIDKLSFESQTNDSLLKNCGWDFQIKIIPNKKDKTLTIEDNWIWLTHDEIIENIWTIAKSWTKEFVESLKKAKQKDNPELIWQFWVWFYSCFMVADKIELTTRKAWAQDAFLWTSNWKWTYQIDKCNKETTWTSIKIHLKKDQEDYLEEFTIKNIVKKYSDFISYPISLRVEKDEKTEDEVVNSQKAIWLRPKSEIKEIEYNDFYKYLCHDHEDPFLYIHQQLEWSLEFRSLIFLPKKAPHNLFHQNSEYWISLYVKRTFILNDCKELIPQYLRFVKWVVDSSDLPLNVSREILQDNPLLVKIKNNLVKKILSTLKEMKEKDYEKYLEFYKEFWKVLKEWVHEDFANKDLLLELLLVESTKTKPWEYTNLKKYVEAMKKDQKEIFFLTWESRNTIEHSPHLESFKKNDIEVLLLSDPIDEWWTSSVNEFEKKPLKQASWSIDDKQNEEDKKVHEEKQKSFSSLLWLITENLKNDIKDVKASNKLVNSPVCLVSDWMSSHMEKMMKAMWQNAPMQKKTLEINLDHPVIKKMQTIYDKDNKSIVLWRYSQLLFNQALMTEWLPIKNMPEFIKDLNELMAS